MCISKSKDSKYGLVLSSVYTVTFFTVASMGLSFISVMVSYSSMMNVLSEEVKRSSSNLILSESYLFRVMFKNLTSSNV